MPHHLMEIIVGKGSRKRRRIKKKKAEGGNDGRRRGVKLLGLSHLTEMLACCGTKTQGRDNETSRGRWAYLNRPCITGKRKSQNFALQSVTERWLRMPKWKMPFPPATELYKVKTIVKDKTTGIPLVKNQGRRNYPYERKRRGKKCLLYSVLYLKPDIKAMIFYLTNRCFKDWQMNRQNKEVLENVCS